jgi:hypothetical protein
MAKVSMSMNLPASADKVWDLIGGFNALPNWHPAVERSEVEGEGKGSVRTLHLAGGAVERSEVEGEGKGSVRTLHLAGGGTITERLEQIDDAGQVYSYSILSSPLPVANYTGTIRLKESADGSGCAVEWESDFQADGAPEGDAVQVIQGIYQAGFDNLKKMFGG